MRETGRDESQNVPSPEKLFKTRDLGLPIFEGSVPSCSPHSAGYTRTSVHPYFPVTNNIFGTEGYLQGTITSQHLNYLGQFQAGSRVYPKNLLRLFFASKIIFIF